jgi:hypothetical protein
MCSNFFKDYVEYLKDNPKGYWFKARIFGWGWTPARWQGWVTSAIFLVLLALNAFRLNVGVYPKNEQPLEFIIETIILVAILFIVCYKTGEKPRWQWGIPKKEKR